MPLPPAVDPKNKLVDPGVKRCKASCVCACQQMGCGCHEGPWPPNPSKKPTPSTAPSTQKEV